MPYSSQAWRQSQDAARSFTRSGHGLVTDDRLTGGDRYDITNLIPE